MRLAIILGALLLGACSQTVVPVTDTRSFTTILSSCKDTVATRQQILRHNSVLDSLRKGKDVVYYDDCEASKPSKPPAKTS